jgi:hypothetical protein
MEDEPILQMGTEKMIPLYAYNKHSQSSSLTDVNGRMDSRQIIRQLYLVQGWVRDQ